MHSYYAEYKEKLKKGLSQFILTGKPIQVNASTRRKG